jgi:hypothetical protein
MKIIWDLGKVHSACQQIIMTLAKQNSGTANAALYRIEKIDNLNLQATSCSTLKVALTKSQA